MIGVILRENDDMIKKTWILLDTFYTDSGTNNLDYVEDTNNCTKDKEVTVFMDG